MICGVVFDFDGTLVDSNAIKARAFEEIARPWDPHLRVWEALRQETPQADRYLLTRRLAEALARTGVLPPEPPPAAWARRWAEDYTQRCEERIAACPERRGASAALRRLQDLGLLLFVNSGTPSAPLQRVVERRGWTACFAGIYGAPAGKLENLRRIVRECGCGPGDLCFVGDGEEDRRAARAFGCAFLGVRSPSVSRFSPPSPPCVEDLREIPERLEFRRGGSCDARANA